MSFYLTQIKIHNYNSLRFGTTKHISDTAAAELKSPVFDNDCIILKDVAGLSFDLCTTSREEIILYRRNIRFFRPARTSRTQYIGAYYRSPRGHYTPIIYNIISIQYSWLVMLHNIVIIRIYGCTCACNS